MTNATPEQLKHQREVIEEINLQIDSLIMSYDAKTLASALLARGGDLLRILIAVNLVTPDHAAKMLESVAIATFVPLPESEKPRVVTSGVASTRAS